MARSPHSLISLPAYGASQIVSAASIRLQLDRPPKSYYRHGWQSWSLTAWTDPAQRLPVMKPISLHSLQTDPVYARHWLPHGSWLGAVELAPGEIVLLGALALEAHVALRYDQLQGWYEAGAGEWFIARGSESDVFALYLDLLGQRFGKGARRAPPRVWCS